MPESTKTQFQRILDYAVADVAKAIQEHGEPRARLRATEWAHNLAFDAYALFMAARKYRRPDLHATLASVMQAERSSEALDSIVYRSVVGFDPDTLTIHSSDVGESEFVFPPVTASVDAALSLANQALPGMMWDLTNHQRLKKRPIKALLWPAPQGGCQQGEAPTLPLAVIVALLKILIQQESDGSP